MGRDWLFKAGGGGVDGSGGSRRNTTTTTTKSVSRKTKRERNSSSSGCMSAIFNYFGLQQYHQFRFHHPSFISESAINNHIDLQGVEAPRNSLELPESAMDVDPPLSSNLKEKTNYNIHMDGIQIKTKRTRLTEDLSSESSSPGTKTPSLVARLMGLDLLPEYSSPRPSSSSTPVISHHHSRSLPATPRISTASRRSTDNDYNHRHSLQIDKENCSRYKGQEHESLRMKMARRRSELLVHREDDERTSEYARQIANQVRERISRRLGTDITNTISRNKEQRRDSNLVLLRPKKPSPLKTPAPAIEIRKDESAPLSRSPKLTLFDIHSNLNKPFTNSQLSSSFKEVTSKPETPPLHQTPLKQKKPVKDEKIQRIKSERYELRLKKMHHQEKICNKSTPIRNHVVNSKNTTKFPSFKKEMTSSSSATSLPQKQVSLLSMTQTQLPSRLNSSYNANNVTMLKLSDQDFITSTGGSPFSDDFDYISRILEHCGIQTTTPISTGQWYSPSHPLHPSIFLKLEKLYHPTATVRRRMMFDLVDELLADFLKPYTNLKPWVFPRTLDSCGSDLIRKLREKIGSIQAADCEAMEDVDGLIERDIGRSIRRLGSTAFEEEAENIVKEIESEIVETLMHEISTVTVSPARSDRMTLHVSFT